MQVASVAYDTVRQPHEGVSFLIYHRVGRHTSASIDMPEALFHEQMAELASTRRALDIDTALTHLTPGVTRGARSPDVVVTFDDGTADWVDHVLPALVEHQVPAVFYVATAYVDSGRDFPNGGAAISWNGLAELASCGLVTIGSHTHNHLLLHDASAAVARDESERSKGLIEDRLGVPCRHFAYPKAVLGSPAAQAEVRARFASATVAGGRANPPGADLYRLQRTPVLDRDTMAWFRRKAAGGLALEGVLRELRDQRRYRAVAHVDDHADHAEPVQPVHALRAREVSDAAVRPTGPAA